MTPLKKEVYLYLVVFVFLQLPNENGWQNGKSAFATQDIYEESIVLSVADILTIATS